MDGKKSFTRSMSFKIHKLVFIMDKIADQLLQKEVGIGFAQFRMLMVLGKYPHVSQKRIAGFMGLTQAAVSKQMNALVHKGWLARKQNPGNRRENVLCLTAKGRKMVLRAAGILEKEFDAYYCAMEEKGKRALERGMDFLLDAFFRNCGQHHGPHKVG
jgi:DNA-binding MarR family transcriptional regulator